MCLKTLIRTLKNSKNVFGAHFTNRLTEIDKRLTHKQQLTLQTNPDVLEINLFNYKRDIENSIFVKIIDLMDHYTDVLNEILL